MSRANVLASIRVYPTHPDRRAQEAHAGHDKSSIEEWSREKTRCSIEVTRQREDNEEDAGPKHERPKEANAEPSRSRNLGRDGHADPLSLHIGKFLSIQDIGAAMP
jgi:hypothetical protein